MGDAACDLSQITCTDTQLLGIEGHIAIMVAETVDGIKKQVVELPAATIVLGIALGLLTHITAGMKHGLVHSLPTTEIVGKGSSQLVGVSVLPDASRQVGGLEYDGAERNELLLDGVIHLRLHQQVATGGVEHRGIDDILRTIFPHEFCHHLHHIDATQQTDLHHLRLKVVEDCLYLCADGSGGQVVELLNTEGVLYGYRSDG